MLETATSTSVAARPTKQTPLDTRNHHQIDLFDQQLNQKRLVKLKTCADVYDYWRAYKRLYKKAPKDGVEFQLEYIDTGLALDEDVRATAPIALALHGAPGSYQDFTLLIRHLSLQNVRVIAPNFPEYVATVETKVLFRHSADEKAAYLRDFLKAINVNKIDLLVSHSSAIFPTLLIVLNANNEAIARQRKLEKQQQETNKSSSSDKKKMRDNNNQLVAGMKSVTLAAFVEEKSGESKPAVNAAHSTLDYNDLRRIKKINRKSLLPSKEEAAQLEELDEETTIASDDSDEDSEDEFEDAKCDIVDDNNNSHEKKDIQQVSKTSNSSKTLRQELEQEKQGDNEERPTKTSRGRGRRNKRRSKQDVIVKFDQPIEIKAVALFNPAGHRLPKSMKPTWLKCGAVHLYQHKLGRSLVRKVGPAFLTVVGVPVRVDNMDNVMLSATVMRNSRCQRVVKQLEQLSELKIPTLLVFSENDKLIEKEIFYEMTKFMNLNPQNFDVFNNEGDIELSQSRTKDWIRVMVFKAGGHYAYSNYAKTVNRAVSELLQKVTKGDKNSYEPIESSVALC